MAWTVNDPEFESVSRLAPEARYDYFVKRAASFGELWGLIEDDSEARSGTSFVFVEGPAKWWYMPIWPHPRYAEAWAEREHPGARPQSIDVDEWVTYWTRRAVADGIKPLIFPTLEDPGHLTGPRELQRNLLEELSLFESQ